MREIKDKVCGLVSEKFNVPIHLIKSKRRSKEVVEARICAQYLMHVSCGLSFSEVGRYFDTDHSTIMHNVDKVDDLQLNDKTGNFKIVLKQLNSKLEEYKKDLQNQEATLPPIIKKVKENTSDLVNHPKHYTSSPTKCSGCGKQIECIDITRHMSFDLGNAVKYIWRADLKNDAIEDLKKAVWYIQDELKKRGVK